MRLAGLLIALSACSFDPGGLAVLPGDDDAGIAREPADASTRADAGDPIEPASADAALMPLETADADVPGPPPPPACDPLTSAGCSPGEACRAWTTPSGEHFQCLPAGSFGNGHGCDGANDCAPGLDCLGVPFAGVCLRYCYQDDADACGDLFGSWCEAFDPAIMAGAHPLGFCTWTP